MTWRLAKSLEVLRDQLNEAHPNRDRASDGSIGDEAHASRQSDHNPNFSGVVTAIDITHDPRNLDGAVLSRQLIKDPRTKYVIFAGKIYRTYKPQLDWATYTGPNGHFHHVHISVSADAGKYDDAAPWSLGAGDPLATACGSDPARRILKRGDKGPAVVELQGILGMPVDTIDGIFGPATEHAVREFQSANHLRIDGIAGPKVYAMLFKT
jgi:peptidoglycan hydrolase-like protein with peptidoglycan-binding domain